MILQILYFAACIAGIIKKKSKILTFMMLCLMWIVFGLCTYNGDYGNYKWIYENIQNPLYWLEFEPLFNVLMYGCSIAGLSFIQFRMVYATIYILLLYYTIGKYTKNKAQVLGFFMIFPYLYFTSVIRSGLAGIIILLAYYELIANNKKIKFLLLILIATMFHYTSIFFISYFFFRKMKLKSILIISASVFLILFLYQSGLLFTIISSVISNERLLRWYITGRADQKTRWIFYLITIVFMILFLSWTSKNDSKITLRYLNFSNPYANDFFYLNITMLLFIPTFFVTNASARLIWEMLIFNIISFVKDDEVRFSGTSITNLRYYRKDFILLIFLLFFSYYANMPYRGTENDAVLVFKNNLVSGAIIQ